MDTTKKLPTVLSLCTGYGGVERGLDLAGVEHRVIAHVEIEAFAIANLVAKMEAGKLDAAPVWSNLKTLPVEPFRDRVDILTGGYPCQPFSAAGKRLGEEDPRHLWPYIRDIIRAVRPVRCFFENVEGHISLGLREVISDLESLGYKVAWGIFSAREVGAPHQRKRVYIMGYASGQRCERSISERDSHGQSEETLGDRSGSEGARSMAYTDSSGLGQGNKEDARQSSEQSDSSGFQSGIISNPNGIGGRALSAGRGFSNVSLSVCQSEEGRSSSNPNNEGLEGRLQGGGVDTEGWEEQEIRCATQRSNRWSGDGHSLWPPEPELGRVVDGCADRVDRIRLLGNGVVPKTAAKAWSVLSEDLE